MSSDEDDMPCLSTEAFAALQEFYQDKNKRQEILTKLEQDDSLKENITFDEDWQLSQFWYDEITIQTIVRLVKKILKPGGKVCLISCPTLFAPLRKALDLGSTVILLEYDLRFKIYGSNFLHYDFNYPQKVPKEICHDFDIVIADPPFLSEECLTKTSETIKLLAKDKIILCTGGIMSEVAMKTLQLKVSQFKPNHRNNLANEFSCFSNFELDEALT